MAKKNSIRIFIPFPSPYLYGAERTILETFDTLRPEVEPHFMLSHGAQRRNLPILGIMKEKGFEHSFMSDTDDWPVPGKPKSLAHLWAILWSLIKFNRDCLKNSKRQDAISLSNTQTIYSALLVCLIFRLQGKRVIFRFHELMIPWTPYSLALKLASPLITDFLHHTRHSYEETVKVNTFLAKRNNSIIPPVVRVRTDETGDAQANEFAGKRNLVFIGQVSPHKGIDLLIEVFTKIAAEYDDVVLHIVGGCSEEYREEFDTSIEVLQAQGKIRHWGFRNDVHSFLRIATVFVQCTRPSVYHESFGRGVVEAMAMGVPSICFRSGALQELVVHEATGLICEEESAACLGAAVQRFLDDTAFRDRCAENAGRRYTEHFSAEGVKQKWLELLQGPAR